MAISTNPMRIRTKLDGDVCKVRVLMSHPMETGLRKDPQGELIPAYFIQLVTVSYRDRVVLTAQWGPAVSRNPYLSFKFQSAAKGETVTIDWLDNKGDTRSARAVIE
ncbi:MAG: thiosulfate oxidation carrier complex protein SoxZ [Betaproteobacteria bacterium]